MASVLGREVNIKIWVHYFIGDTEGNNKWLGHYPGARQVHRPYRDCQCDFNNMSNPNPTCVYTTLSDMRDAKRFQWLFPREENSNGYCIPKMHGMAKFQSYIKRYGSAMNFKGEQVNLLTNNL